MAGMIQQAAQAPEQVPQGQVQDPSQDPGFDQAMTFAMEALYKNKAGVDVGKGIQAAQNKVEAIANAAYEIVSITDERTNGAVPDELLVLFSTRILEEVCEIAQAAKVQVTGSMVAEAMKQMILRYLGEQGVDASQLQQAMDQVDTSQFDKEAA